jgi:hypothetical protein
MPWDKIRHCGYGQERVADIKDSKPSGAPLATAETCGANAARLADYAANLSDPIARAEFELLSAEWERLAVLANWQARVTVSLA